MSTHIAIRAHHASVYLASGTTFNTLVSHCNSLACQDINTAQPQGAQTITYVFM